VSSTLQETWLLGPPFPLLQKLLFLPIGSRGYSPFSLKPNVIRTLFFSLFLMKPGTHSFVQSTRFHVFPSFSPSIPRLAPPKHLPSLSFSSFGIGLPCFLQCKLRFVRVRRSLLLSPWRRNSECPPFPFFIFLSQEPFVGSAGFPCLCVFRDFRRTGEGPGDAPPPKERGEREEIPGTKERSDVPPPPPFLEDESFLLRGSSPQELRPLTVPGPQRPFRPSSLSVRNKHFFLTWHTLQRAVVFFKGSPTIYCPFLSPFLPWRSSSFFVHLTPNSSLVLPFGGCLTDSLGRLTNVLSVPLGKWVWLRLFGEKLW